MARSVPRRRLRWLVVLVPVAVVAALELLSDTLLDEALPFPWDTLLVALAVLVFASLLGAFAFRRIDALTETLRARNAEQEARGASARALYRVSVAIASLTDLDRVLDAVVTHARDLLQADVAVLLLEAPDGRLERRAAAGNAAARGDAAAPGDAVGPAGAEAAANLVPTADPIAGDGHAAASAAVPGGTDEAPANPADAMLAFVAPGAAVVRLSAPLRRGGQTIGLLAIGAARPRGFDADEVETLASLANQAAIAVEHARLEARLRELAVVEERERIARELHDGIAQVLGYVNTKSLAIDGYLADGRIGEARAQVTELGAAARAVYVDVREAILGLRSPMEPGVGLAVAIEAYARQVAADTRFALEISIPPAARDLRLDPETEGEVYRIAQEALTNVRKHAAARRVRISMGIGKGELTLRIEDDGRGIEATAPSADVPHYGLRSMAERAAAIGATFEVGEGPRGGVLVTLVLPLASHRQLPTDPGAPGDDPTPPGDDPTPPGDDPTLPPDQPGVAAAPSTTSSPMGH